MNLPGRARRRGTPPTGRLGWWGPGRLGPPDGGPPPTRARPPGKTAWSRAPAGAPAARARRTARTRGGPWRTSPGSTASGTETEAELARESRRVWAPGRLTLVRSDAASGDPGWRGRLRVVCFVGQGAWRRKPAAARHSASPPEPGRRWGGLAATWPLALPALSWPRCNAGGSPWLSPWIALQRWWRECSAECAPPPADGKPLDRLRRRSSACTSTPVTNKLPLISPRGKFSWLVLLVSGLALCDFGEVTGRSPSHRSRRRSSSR